MNIRQLERSTDNRPRLTIGRDSHGWWVVRDRLDKVGGVFASETAARHFAFEECHCRGCDVDSAAPHEPVELDALSGVKDTGEPLLLRRRA